MALALPRTMLARSRGSAGTAVAAAVRQRLATGHAVARGFGVVPQVNPQTGEVFKEYTTYAKEQVEGIVASADGAFREWRRVPPKERVATLAPMAELLRGRADEAAELMNKEMGKPVPQGKAEVLKCAYLVDWYAEHGAKFLEDTEHPPLPGFKRSYVTYQPLGVILSVMPWNFPFWQVIRMSIPTLMAGNAVVLKHARNCFGSSLMLEEIYRSVPGLPGDLFRALVIGGGEVDAVLENEAVRGIALTGSTEVGRQVAAKAGSLLKKAVVELGGSDGYVILADADLEAAAKAVVSGRILNTGQVCISPKRVLVEKSVKAAFEEKVLEQLATKAYGVDFGPMVNKGARDEVAGMVRATQDAGARLLAGGTDVPAPDGDSGKSFLAPTVLTDVRPGMVAFDEEIFGPVLAITEAADEADAVRLANSSEFGLGAAVFTGDHERGQRIAVGDLEAGMCFVNDFVRSDPSLPFGGVKNSGLGRECSVFGMMEFVNVKTVCVK